MAEDFSFSLSLAALDLLWGQLQLGAPVLIFQVPSVGDTMEDRARLLEAVYRDLTSRQLAHRGRLAPEVEESLVTLARFRHAIDVIGLLEGEQRLCARIATNGRIGVAARVQGQIVTFDVLRPEELVHASLRLIGDERPGPGQSVTFPESGPAAEQRIQGRHRADDDGFGSILEGSRPAAGGYHLQLRAARTIWEKPRRRFGFFTVHGRDRNGRPADAPPLVWFDTDDGRYMGHSRPSPDGQRWTTYAPSDNRRLGQQLVEILNTVGQPSR